QRGDLRADRPGPDGFPVDGDCLDRPIGAATSEEVRACRVVVAQRLWQPGEDADKGGLITQESWREIGNGDGKSPARASIGCERLNLGERLGDFPGLAMVFGPRRHEPGEGREGTAGEIGAIELSKMTGRPAVLGRRPLPTKAID